MSTIRCMEPVFTCKNKPEHVCGGVLYPEGEGCGRPFCDYHLVGKLGPFYCELCWAEKKQRRLAL